MKKIRFSRYLNFENTITGPGIDTVAGQDLLDIARANKLEIVDAVLAMEYNLSVIIGHYFYPSKTEKKDAFMSLVVGSDWCSFSAKRKLVNHIIKETKILENFHGIEPGKFDKLLGNAMRYRNAFTHGTPSTDGKTWLQYYEARPIKKELTDEFLEQVKQEIGTALMQAHQLAGLLGAFN